MHPRSYSSKCQFGYRISKKTWVERVVPTSRWRNVYKVSVRKREVKSLWSSFNWLANKSPGFVQGAELLSLAPVRGLSYMKFAFMQTLIYACDPYGINIFFSLVDLLLH